MKNWWRTDEELMKNWWRTVEDYYRLPQTATDWLVLLHWTLKPISGIYSSTYIYIYIPDSTNYKSTASGANKALSLRAERRVAFLSFHPFSSPNFRSVLEYHPQMAPSSYWFWMLETGTRQIIIWKACFSWPIFSSKRGCCTIKGCGMVLTERYWDPVESQGSKIAQQGSLIVGFSIAQCLIIYFLLMLQHQFSLISGVKSISA